MDQNEDRILTRRQLVMAAALLLLGGWVSYRTLFVVTMSMPSVIKAGQDISLHVSYPGWRPQRVSVWLCPTETEDFHGIVNDAVLRWDGRYHFDLSIPGAETSGTYDIYLVYGSDKPFGSRIATQARITVVP
jgi:hypothetical protein